MKNLYAAGHGGDLNADVSGDGGILSGSAGNDALMDAMVDGREIWLGDQRDDDDHHHKDHPHKDDDLLAQDPSIFYSDLPPLPDFPCMSSSSSSSTSPLPVNAIVSSASLSSSASSSSSAASWAILKSDGEDNQNQNQYQGNCEASDASASVAALQSTASMEIPVHHEGTDGVDCVDMMETFGYMDLLDGNDFFDTSAIFQQEEATPQLEKPNLIEQHEEKQIVTVLDQEHHQTNLLMMQNNGHEEIIGGSGEIQANSSLDQDEDLAMVFLEWLKSNKETVSAEDLRKVKIKKATIESAARRLGGGKEAMKQLLKLILEWVQTNHLQKRRNNSNSLAYPPQQQYYQDPFQNPNPNNNPLTPLSDPSSCFSQSTWISPPQPPSAFVSDAGIPGLGSHLGVGYMGSAPFPGGAAPNYPQPPPEYHPLLESPSWAPPQPPPHQFPVANAQYNPFPDTCFTGYPSPYPYPYLQGQMGDQRLLRLCSSATKEARKKRMARQRRFLSHHHRYHGNTNNQQNMNQQNQNQIGEHARVGDNCAAPQLNPTAGNLMYWPNVPAVAPGSAQPPAMESQAVVDRAGSAAMQAGYQPQRQVASDRRQGWKPEKNLRFLLQKVLKQSDVGNLGRIVLPKKEAETHLPELEARDGISLAMEDIGTSRVWHMRYRFWPNNKSRMYLLENTGDFVKTNGLQEGDFIVIYSDVKCGKYLIRGVKVRQPAGAKSETPTPAAAAAAVRRQSKSQRHNNNNSPSAYAVASTTSQTVK